MKNACKYSIQISCSFSSVKPLHFSHCERIRINISEIKTVWTMIIRTKILWLFLKFRIMFWVSPIIVRMILRTQNLKTSIFAVASKTYPSPYGAYGYIGKKCRHTQMVDYWSNAWSPWEVFLAVANIYRNDKIFD